MTEATPLLIGDLVARNGAQVPTWPAVSFGDRTLSHSELDRAANSVARSLRGAGLVHGDRLVCWSATRLDVIVLFAATSKLGAVFAPLNAMYGQAEAQPVIAMARPAFLVCDAAHLEAARQIRSELGIRGLACFDTAGDTRTLDLDLDTALQEPADGTEAVSEPALRESDPHVIFFTSGSTGLPKGVVLSHRANYLRSFQGVFLQVPERSVCMFPLFHMAGFTLSLAAWQTRGEIILVEAASAEGILSAVEARSANRLYCIPAVWHRILETPAERYDTSSLKLLDTGTSATPVALLESLKARYPEALLRVFYGSTESGSVTILSDADVLRKPGSVGQPSPGVDLRLSDAGEICLRSAYLMDGYFDAPEQTAEALRAGWLHTGDLACLDAEGYISITGRLKDLIRTGGESFAPTEVEVVLASHPDLADVAVVGLPDAEWGEIVCAVVVARPGTEPDLASLQAHCADRLAAFKKPRRLVRLDALPRTPATNQVQRLALVERLLSG
jgi:fatty-acyl-CoA synthase